MTYISTMPGESSLAGSKPWNENQFFTEHKYCCVLYSISPALH